MAGKTADQLKTEAINVLAWALGNGIVTETGSPIEVHRRTFLIDPYMDNSPMLAVRKCAQIGWSTLAILKAIHLANFYKLNIIYTLPNRNVVKDFVVPKVNPIISKNKVIRDLISHTNSVSLKQIGDRFIYYRGTFEDKEAISISADVLLMDEFDRSNQNVIQTYRSRLAASEWGWQHMFSNPSVDDFGVDKWWRESDKKFWFIKPSCGHEQFLDWPDNVDIEKGVYICRECGVPIADEERRLGRWVAKHPGRDISGYWISHLMASWIPASRVIDESEMDRQYFHNFVLGKPFIAEDMKIGRTQIMRAVSPDDIARTNNVMGVDTGVEKWYVIGNKEGVFRYGKTESWDEIERLRNQYRAYMVIDPNPYPTQPKKLVDKYRGKIFLAYYNKDRKSPEMIRWGKSRQVGGVLIDRTKIIDMVVAEINSKDLLFALNPSEMEEMISHWESMYRIIKQDSAGIERGVWETKEGKPSHLAHALCYYRVALEKVISGGGGGVRVRSAGRRSDATIEIDPETQSIPALNIQEIAKRSLSLISGGDWRY